MQPQASTNIFKSVLLLWLDLCYRKTATPQSQPTTQTQGLFVQSESNALGQGKKERKNLNKMTKLAGTLNDREASIKIASIFIRKPFAITTHLVIIQQIRCRLGLSWLDLEGPWRRDSPLSCVDRSDSGPSLTPEQPFLQQSSTDHSSKPTEQTSQCLLIPESYSLFAPELHIITLILK